MIPPETHLTIGDKDIHLRLLQADDSARLGRYFEALSAETRRRFGPHPLDAETAASLCAAPDPLIQRWVALYKDRIIAYVIVERRLNPPEQARYQVYGIPLDPEQTCTLAPSVADDFQGQGVGSPMVAHIIRQAAGRGTVVLMGGTQATNARALHFYRKLGFQEVGQFEHPQGQLNVDMYL